MKVVQLNPSIVLHGSLIEPGTFKGHTEPRYAQIFDVSSQADNRRYHRVEFVENPLLPASEIEWPWALIQLSFDDAYPSSGILPVHTLDSLSKMAKDAIALHCEAMQAKKEKDEKEAEKAAREEAKKAKKV